MRTEQMQAPSAQVTAPDLSVPVDLVRAIHDGNPDAESALIEKYERGLRFLVHHHTNDRALAEDVVQETFIVALKRLRTRGIDEPSKLSPFLHQTARNIMIGHLRKIARRRTSADTEQVECTVGGLEDQHSAAVRDQDALIVRQLMAELKCERDREILVRFYLREDEKADICRDLKLSDVHFNRVLYRARQRFGALVKEFEQRDGSRFL